MTYVSWICLIFVIVSTISLARAAEDDPTATPVEAEYARIISVCWEAPMAYVNGTPLDPATELLQYEVEVQHPEGTETQSVVNVLEYEHMIRRNGPHCFRVRAQATNQFYSEWTEQICRDIASAPVRMKMRFCDD